MKIIKIDNYYTDENCYMLINEGDALVIDPGSEAEKIMKFAADENAQIKYILLTHCHYDHISGVPELREKTGAKLAVTDICAVNIADRKINLTESALDEVIELKNPEIILSPDKDEVLCGMTVKTLKTPGHTSCSTCFLINNHLFSGDTLFLRNVGRWDLPTGDGDVLCKSIRDVLYTLDEKTFVHPGHGAETQIGYEKKYNFCCRG